MKEASNAGLLDRAYLGAWVAAALGAGPPLPKCLAADAAPSALLPTAAMIVLFCCSADESPVTSWPPLIQRKPRSNSSFGSEKTRTAAE